MTLPYRIYSATSDLEPRGKITVVARDENNQAFRLQGELAAMFTASDPEPGQAYPDVSEITVGNMHNMPAVCRAAVSMAIRSGLLADALFYALKHEPDTTLRHINTALLHHQKSLPPTNEGE